MMRLTIVSFVLFSILCGVCYSEEEIQREVVGGEIGSDPAPFLTGEDFYDALEASPTSVVLFTRTSGGCPECDVAMDAITQYSEEGLDCPTFIVDCQKDIQLCQELYEFRSLPQILIFVDDVGIYEYQRGYVFYDALKSFVKEHLKPKLSTIQLYSELEPLIEEYKLLVVGFFTPETEKERGSFRRTAGQLYEDYPFVEVVMEDKKTLESFQESYITYDTIEDGDIHMIKRIGEDVTVITFDSTTVSRRRITSWIRKNTPWPVKEMEASREIINPSDDYAYLPLLTVYADYRVKGNKEEAVVMLERISEDVRGKLALTYMDGSPEEFDSIFIRWGYKPNNFPIAMIAKPVSRDVYTYEGELNQETLREFARSFLAGELSPHIIKQEESEGQEGLVTSVVHDTWRNEVLFSEKDVAVLFYLPEDECPHCIDFVETFEETALQLKDQFPDLSFAKLDVHHNAQVPGVRVSNFPAVKLYPKESKFNPIAYAGPRRIEGLTKFLKDQLIRDTESSLGQAA